MITVTLELELEPGKHFIARPTKAACVDEAIGAFIDWLDSWYKEEDKSILREYIQARVTDERFYDA